MTPIERIYTIASIIAMLFFVIVVAKFITKRLNKKSSAFFKRADTRLMKIHKPAAIILIVFGAFHGILSLSNFPRFGILPYIMGIIGLVSCIISAACFQIKTRLKHSKPRILHHRFFAVIALFTLIGHIALSI